MKRTLLAALFLVPSLAPAQAPPPEPAPPPPPPLWSGKAELSYVSTSGNTSTSTLGFAGELAFKPDPWSVTARGAFVRAETDGELKARSLDLALRTGYKLSERVELFNLCSYFENSFSGIDHRWSDDVGAAWQALTAETHKLKVEAGVGYTKEWRTTEETRSFATGRVGLGYKWAISKTAELSEDLGVLMNLSQTDDWRVQNVFAVSASLTSLFSLKVSHTLNYLHDPPEGFGRTDTVTAAALVAKF